MDQCYGDYGSHINMHTDVNNANKTLQIWNFFSLEFLLFNHIGNSICNATKKKKSRANHTNCSLEL